MKITYLKSGQINYKKWDACIEQSLNTYIYPYSWYLDLLADDWDALVMGDYEYVFPLPFRSRYGVKYVYQPVFTQQLGVFSPKTIQPDIVARFLEAIPKHFKLIELNLNKYNVVHDAVLSRMNVNVELDLIPPYEVLKSAYSSNHKRNIKKALSNSLVLDKNIKPEEMVALFREHKGKDLGVFDEADYRKLLRLSYAMMYKGLAAVWGVYDESNRLLATSLWLRSSHRYIMLFTGLSEEGRRVSAMHFLVDQFIQQYAGSPTILDFEGSNDPGLQRFILGFGSGVHHYPGIRINRLSALSKALAALYKKLK